MKEYLYNPQIHNRRSIRLPYYDYSSPGLYYITICSNNQECIFGEIKNNKMMLSKTGRIINKQWLLLTNKFKNIDLDEYIIMPNHLHGIINIKYIVGVIHELPLQRKSRIDRRKMLLPKIIGYYKMNTAKIINKHINNIGQMVWQRNYGACPERM